MSNSKPTIAEQINELLLYAEVEGNHHLFAVINEMRNVRINGKNLSSYQIAQLDSLYKEFMKES